MITTNESLVNHLINSGALKTQSIIDAFLKVDRQNFVLPEYHDQAYNDYPLPIGYGQTISQPFTVAFMLELLSPIKGNKVLDVGFGSGWTTCLLSFIVNPGKVYAIEIIPEIFSFGENNIKKFNLLSKGLVEVFLGDGSKGMIDQSPFDRILVSAAFGHKIPSELINQLSSKGGRLVIPDNSGIWQIIKENNQIKKKYYPGFIFVPLIE
jgi:protein-L-isoaspartate(D-aspartate) O-methyltransferase